MITTRSVALLVLVVVVGLTVAPIASGAVVDAFADDAEDEESEPSATVSTFMQASAADTENTVDSGMFEAKYENADNESRADIVNERATELEERLTALEAERDALRENRDDLHRGEYQSRMAKLAVEIRSLERSIEGTERRANETGIDDDRFAELRGNAAALNGPDVEKAARGLGVVGGIPGSPPDDRGNQGEGNDRGDQNQGNDRGNQGQGDDLGNQARGDDREQKNAKRPGHADSPTDEDGSETGSNPGSGDGNGSGNSHDEDD